MARVEGNINGDGEIIYYHHDNLGSTRLMTDGSGEIVFDQDYLPFGGDLPNGEELEVYDEIGERYKFTGQREEISIGLYYYGARYYDPFIGRFITEDTYPGGISNPQSQNLYIYVINNPLRYTDPTGHRLVEIDPNETPSKETEEAMKKIYGDGWSDTRDNNTNIEIPNVNIGDILYQLNNYHIEVDVKEPFDNLSVRERKIIEKLGSIDPELLTSNTTFTIPCLTGIIPFGFGFDALVETYRTLNVKEGNGKFSINISGDSISFVTPQGELAAFYQKPALDFGVNVGKQFDIEINERTKISWNVGFDKLGPNLIYTFDHSKYDQTVDTMNVRPYLNDRTMKFARDAAIFTEGSLTILIFPEIAPVLVPAFETAY